MKAFSTIEEAIDQIKRYEGKAEDFKLPISDELLDPIGMNMAIITDAILGKNFEPNGFEQEEGYRVYLYKELG